MPVPLVALLAASLHQAQSADVEPADLARAVGLLTRAVGGAPVTLVVTDNGLVVNDTALPATAPGIEGVLAALAKHRIEWLAIPRGVESPRWGQLVELLASTRGLYSSLEQFGDALRLIAPGAEIRGAVEPGMIRDAPFSGFAGAQEFGNTATLKTLGASNVDRSELSVRLDPLIASGQHAIADGDNEALAEALLKLADLEREGGGASVAIERRRLAPPAVVQALARQLPDAATPSVIARALIGLGAEAADAIAEVLRDAATRTERRAYINTLAEIPEATETILAALKGTEPQPLADVAEVAGRRTLEAAVPALASLLRHHDEEVRTSAWHALEQIGTPAAKDALGR